MDILIKNMEMPKYCRGCHFEVSSIYGQQCFITRKFTRLNDNEDGMKRHISCPLNPLPEHGRLGDLELVEEWMRKKHKEHDCPFNIDAFLVALKRFPTIVEANNGTDN